MKDLCQPDETNRDFNITIESLKESVAMVSISEKVLQKFQELLEVAKKLYLYSYYEWDFYTVCLIYLLLLSETAIKERFLQELPQECKLVKKECVEKVQKSYTIIYERLFKRWRLVGYEKVDGSLLSIAHWLKEHNILPDRFNEFVLETLIKLRNYAAHLEAKHLWPPAIVIQTFWKVVDLVNCLFDIEAHNSEPEALKKMRAEYEALYREIESTNTSDE